MSKSITELVDELPKDGMTVMTLKALDFVVPGEWQNVVGFQNTVRDVTGEDDPALIQQISERALWLYNDKNEGYQRALWLYQTVDKTDMALGAAALANKVSEKVSFLSFLGNITPKSETAQSLDLVLKVVVELVAFCQINGIPGDSIGDFVASLADYGGVNLMRMAALVCLDGLIPLGPDFVKSAGQTISGLTPDRLEENATFKQISRLIPGNDTQGKLSFIGESFDSVQGWMKGFVQDRRLNPQMVVNHLKSFMDIADDKLDYLAGFLDVTTNYYEHTGTQTLARCLIERAPAEV